MSTPIIDEAAKVFADPTAYTDEPRLHARSRIDEPTPPSRWSTVRRIHDVGVFGDCQNGRAR
jgi:hypothetical protein